MLKSGLSECDSDSSFSSSSLSVFGNWKCPESCSCVDSVVDCRNKKLTAFPKGFPSDTTEIRLEQNQLTEIPSKAFMGYKRLRRIDVSNNEIRNIATDAFTGLKSLTSLVLYGNRITHLPSSVFSGLTSLQLLLLNSNRIKCIHNEAFKDLSSISLLSLYDNKIQSLENGTFNGLTQMQTLHLARNPFYCNCDQKWLVGWMKKNPVETSGVRCEEPKNLHKKKMISLDQGMMQCTNDPTERALAQRCSETMNCPSQCSCHSGIVDCSDRNLKEIPQSIPMSTVKLVLTNNQIEKIPAIGLFNRLPKLQHLDLARNDISEIEEGAFEGASSIQEISFSQNQITKLNNRILRGLNGLESLNLFSNDISCITPGAFDSLRSLKSLNLISNPFNCNCHMGWFAEWVREKGFVENGPRCASPDALKNRAIHSLSVHDFQCTDNNEAGCLGENYCPPSCTCTGTIVRCSHANLKRIPEGIPRETSELYLDVNKIESIDIERIKHLSSLTRLDLSNNAINVLPPYVFANLTRLATLIVSYNKLQCVQENSFFGLANLRILSLHGNEISMIPEEAFDRRSSVTHLALGSNPFHCDCKLQWLSNWIKRDYIEPGIANCHSPDRLGGKLILTTPSEGFECLESPPQSILAKCNLCHTNPCKNDATCLPLPNRDYKCQCTPGFYGKNCDSVIDACYGNPCDNNAKCTVVEAGRFNCECLPGYGGTRCQENINDCLNHRCKNNATCVDGLEVYHCACAEGFTGKYCESRIPNCPEGNNPCHNGGKCIDHLTHFTCECKEGYSGFNCSENIDECANNLCQNGGKCVDGINDYTCQCPPEFQGKFCEIEPTIAQLYPQTSPCQQHDCKHGICFQPRDSLEYICKCAPGYSGKRCEYLTSLSFLHNNSFVEMEPLNVIPYANVTIEFASNQDNGILLYTGSDQHLAVELFRGRIRVSYDVGNYPVSTMFSYELVSDGKFHRIEILAVKKNFTLRVDNGLARSIVNEGKNEFLKNGRNPLYIAGVPENVGQRAIKQWHLRNVTSFHGCVQKLVVNEKLVDFLQAATVRQKVSPGCSRYQDEQPETEGEIENPCKRKPCKHGDCKQIDKKPGFTCKCEHGYEGRLCDIRENPYLQRDNGKTENTRKNRQRKKKRKNRACKKQKYRDYFSEEGGCTSKRPYNMAKCVVVDKKKGTQCKTTKTKKRVIRFECQDGRKYKKEVEIVARCGKVRKNKNKNRRVRKSNNSWF